MHDLYHTILQMQRNNTEYAKYFLLENSQINLTPKIDFAGKPGYSQYYQNERDNRWDKDIFRFIH